MSVREHVRSPPGVRHAAGELSAPLRLAELEKRRTPEAHDVLKMEKRLHRGAAVVRLDENTGGRNGNYALPRGEFSVKLDFDRGIRSILIDERPYAHRHVEEVGEIFAGNLAAVAELEFIGGFEQREIADIALVHLLQPFTESVQRLAQRDDLHAVDIRHRRGRIEKPDLMDALRHILDQRDLGEIPSVRRNRQLARFPAVDLHKEIALLRRMAAEHQFSPPGRRCVNIFPDQIVRPPRPEIRNRDSERRACNLRTDGASSFGAALLEVFADLGVIRKISSLRLVNAAFQTALGVETEKARRVGTDFHNDLVFELSDIGAFDEVESRNAPAEIERFDVDAEFMLTVAGVVERHIARTAETLFGVFDQHVRFAVTGGDVRLETERILVDSEQERIGHKFERPSGDYPHIVAEHERRRKHAPHSEVRRFLVGSDPRIAGLAERRLHDSVQLSHLKHVKVVEMPGLGISAQIKVFSDNVANRFPTGADISRRAPGTGDVGRPRSGKRPAADVEAHILAPGGGDGLGDFGVTILFIKLHPSAAAIVDLDEIEAEFVEIQFAVLRIVSPKPGADAGMVAVEDAAAGVGSRVGIGSGLHAERMNPVDGSFHSFRETHRMELKPSVGVVALEESVIDVHVDESRRLETVGGHCPGDAENDLLGNIDGERIPARPSH